MIRDPRKLATLLDDPIRFIHMCWPHIKLYDKQAEIIRSVRDYPETFVHAANEVGKDFIASLVAIWFFASRNPARVITSSSGETQLQSILWSEIKNHIVTSKLTLPWQVDSLKIRRYKGEDGRLDAKSYIIGHVTRTVENFQGHHLPQDKPRVLCIFDEASGIPDEFYEAADSWAHRKLVIGNPLNTTNFFFRCCKGGNMDIDGNKFRNVIHISADHSPNVIIGKELERREKGPPKKLVVPGLISYHDYRIREQKWDEVKKTTRLYGHFYEGEEALLYPPEMLDRSHRIKVCGQAVAMGLDTASGRDMTCWTVISDNGILKQVTKQTPETMAIAGYTIELIRKFRINPGKVVIDSGGGGKQIADRIREQGIQVRTVNFGEAPTSSVGKKSSRELKILEDETKKTYKNRRAEMYGILRDRLDSEDGFGIPESLSELRQELAIMPLYYDSEGKMYLPPKDKVVSRTNTVTIRSILGRSPDRADSLVMAVYATKTYSRPVGAF